MKRVEDVKELCGLKQEVSVSPESEGSHRVLVIPCEKMALGEQLNHFGIESQVPVENFRNEPRRTNPYLLEVRVSDETGISPNDVRKSMGGEGLNIEEGLALAYQHPDVLHGRSIDLVNSTYRTESTPTVYRWNSETRLSAICSDVADPMCGPAFVEKVIKEF